MPKMISRNERLPSATRDQHSSREKLGNRLTLLYSKSTFLAIEHSPWILWNNLKMNWVSDSSPMRSHHEERH